MSYLALLPREIRQELLLFEDYGDVIERPSSLEFCGLCDNEWWKKKASVLPYREEVDEEVDEEEMVRKLDDLKEPEVKKYKSADEIFEKYCRGQPASEAYLQILMLSGRYVRGSERHLRANGFLNAVSYAAANRDPALVMYFLDACGAKPRLGGLAVFSSCVDMAATKFAENNDVKSINELKEKYSSAVLSNSVIRGSIVGGHLDLLKEYYTPERPRTNDFNLAVKHGHILVIKYLLEERGTVNVQTVQNATYVAVERNFLGVMDYLYRWLDSMGRKPDMVDLRIAISSNNVLTLKTVLKYSDYNSALEAFVGEVPYVSYFETRCPAKTIRYCLDRFLISRERIENILEDIRVWKGKDVELTFLERLLIDYL